MHGANPQITVCYYINVPTLYLETLLNGSECHYKGVIRTVGIALTIAHLKYEMR